MNKQYYLVNKKILPDFIDEIIKIKEEIEEEGISVSTACEKHNISRSTYYKYKDLVFKPIQNVTNRAIISFRALNVKGVLSNVLTEIANLNANVITLNQDMPINDYAFITIIDFIIVMDLCSSSLILEELQKNGKIRVWRRFWKRIFKMMAQNPYMSLRCKPYKFVGDGFIILYRHQFSDSLFEFVLFYFPLLI